MIKLKPTSGKFDFLSLSQLTTVIWKLKLTVTIELSDALEPTEPTVPAAAAMD